MLSTRKLRVAAGLGRQRARRRRGRLDRAPRRTSQSAKIVIWADADRVAGGRRGRQRLGRSQGRRPSRSSRSTSARSATNLKTVAVDDAPDVIVGAHDWVGELSAQRLDHPALPVAPRRRSSSRAYALNAFSYGTAIKKLYGAPVALENIALVTNTKLAKVPTTFARPRGAGARGRRRRRSRRSASPSSRARAATRTTCTRSSPASAATSSARTRPATSTRRTSASRTRVPEERAR